VLIACTPWASELIALLKVIYGDTDSIMIATHTDDLKLVKEMGFKLQKEVNKKYKKLEIEMDGFFQKMLLLKKKKYAALTVTEEDGGTLKINKETKGLDLVRRDWCELSHEVSKYVTGELSVSPCCWAHFVVSYVLDQILSGLEREQILSNIHEYLVTVGERIREGSISLDKFVINKVSRGSLFAMSSPANIKCSVVGSYAKSRRVPWCQKPTPRTGRVENEG
jgi:DNA polymerase alpha subunit A